MAILSDEDIDAVKGELEAMENEITIHLFTSDDCQYCDQTVELNEELAGVSDLITLEVHDFDDPLAEEYDAAKYETGPVAAITRNGLKGVKYFGIPSGQEFAGYLQDIITVSTGKTDLPDSVRQELKEIDEEVNIKVFVTPTCPYCPQAVRTAHDFAIENPNIVGEMIESQEFMEVSQEFNVRSVPQINVNGNASQFTGALPPEQFLQEVKNAL